MTPEDFDKTLTMKIRCGCCQDEFIVGIREICYPCFIRHTKKGFVLMDLRKTAYQTLVIFLVSWTVLHYFDWKVQMIANVCMVIGMGIDPITRWLASKF
jgi:hypothetical protein